MVQNQGTEDPLLARNLGLKRIVNVSMYLPQIDLKQ